MDEMLRYLNQDVNVYDNYIELFTNQFLSPIADKAPLFYRYYPMDTTVEDGLKIVHLSFFPRNKTDMLLQGDLYVALDCLQFRFASDEGLHHEPEFLLEGRLDPRSSAAEMYCSPRKSR